MGVQVVASDTERSDREGTQRMCLQFMLHVFASVRTNRAQAGGLESPGEVFLLLQGPPAVAARCHGAEVLPLHRAAWVTKRSSRAVVPLAGAADLLKLHGATRNAARLCRGVSPEYLKKMILGLFEEVFFG
jgi:hypothetical protein